MAPAEFCADCQEFSARIDDKCDRDKRWEPVLPKLRRTLRANDGCELCQFLSAIAQAALRDGTTGPSESVDVELTGQRENPFSLSIEGSNPSSWGLVVLDICKVTGSDGVSTIPSKDDWKSYSIGEFESHIPRVCSEDPCSNTTVQMMKDWASVCSEKHDYCKDVVPSVLPTRVVRLVPDGTIRLHCAGEGFTSYYAILSHPWGPQGPKVKTTMSNLAAHLNAMNQDSLARNFQDALRVARLLGYEYIWIDALCIVQDDPDDWDREASRMAEYYYNSSIMISAASARTCEDGFLHKRSDMYSPPIGMDKQFRLKEYWYSEDEFLSSPITSRAWTFQERFTAPRSLHFLAEEVLWECGHGFMSEGYVNNGTQRHSGERRLSRLVLNSILEEDLLYSNKRQQFPGSPAWEEVTSSITESWCEILHEYTARSLTFPKDKLPAIAGLARLVQKPRFGKYLAGFWQQNLFRQLCWYRSSDRNNGLARFGDLPRPKNQGHNPETKVDEDTASASYRAPSWSWAAGDGQIGFPLNIGNPPNRSFPVEQLWHEYSHWVSVYTPRLVESNMLSKVKDEYLKLSQGSYIEVEGYCRCVYCPFNRTESEEASIAAEQEAEDDQIIDGPVDQVTGNKKEDSEDEDDDDDDDDDASDLNSTYLNTRWGLDIDDMDEPVRGYGSQPSDSNVISEVIIDKSEETSQLLPGGILLATDLTFEPPTEAPEQPSTSVTGATDQPKLPPSPQRQSSQRFLLLQLEKEYYQDRRVWALLLTEHEHESEHTRADASPSTEPTISYTYKRIGLVSLAHYNLCSFMPTDFAGSWKVPTDDVLHPVERERRRRERMDARRERIGEKGKKGGFAWGWPEWLDEDYGGRMSDGSGSRNDGRLEALEEGMKTEEWAREKWMKRRLRLV